MNREAALDVTLVIPGRNAADTLEPCLASVSGLLGENGLREIIFVDDGSTDDSVQIAARFPVRCLRGRGEGPGAARNLGFRAARTPLVWFIDADCVAEPDALLRLRDLLRDPVIAAAGGSYGNMLPDSLLASLIHEEIIERHLQMPSEVDFLATFNVVYRRDVLERLGGFDENFLKAQDAELAYRARRAGGRLAFDRLSRVKHFHPDRLAGYLRTQSAQGYWRVWLYFAYPGQMGGDSYSGVWDHVQPPLSMLALGSLVLVLLPIADGLCAALAALAWGGLAVSQVPMSLRLSRRTGAFRCFAFAALGFLRAFARGIGMTHATLAILRKRMGPRRPDLATSP